MFHDTASVLFGAEGLQVTDAQAGPDGTLEVWAVTGYPAAAACPDCRAVSARRHDTVLSRPRDVRRAGDPVAAWWVKCRRKCQDERCGRKTFTEWVPQVPPRCRLTARLREQAGAEVTGRGIAPAEAARHAGVSWPVARDAFAAAADPVLDYTPALVAHLGIDEHRRDKPRWRTDADTGEYVPFAGIAFLWFIGVLRNRIGDREDRFFATVFLGSGLLFVAMMFVATAIASGSSRT